MKTRLLLLNVMVSGPFENAMDQHLSLGLKDLDLKTNWSGSMIENTSCEEAHELAAAADARGMQVHCLSSCTGNLRIDSSAEELKEQDAQVDQLCRLVPILNPRCVRLIVPRGDEAVVHDPKVVARYQKWIDQLHACGVQVVMENEIGGSIGRLPTLVDAFFKNLKNVGYIWDIANQWQEGSYPSAEDYALLKPHIAMLHVKGGRWNNDQEKQYAWKSQLAESDWPVAELCRAALNDGINTICINPPHGQMPDSWEYNLENDIQFMNELMELTHV